MPGGAFVFIDVNEKSICWPYFGVKMDTEAFFNWPSSVHNRGGVVAFADSHVEYHKWVDQRTITAYSSDYHQHNDGSPLNKDLTWIKDRTTIRR
jgi:prepilin-type processing-associated H-X9-DG protein